MEVETIKKVKADLNAATLCMTWTGLLFVFMMLALAKGDSPVPMVRTAVLLTLAGICAIVCGHCANWRARRLAQLIRLEAASSDHYSVAPPAQQPEA